jgi:hypothetical protein
VFDVVKPGFLAVLTPWDPGFTASGRPGGRAEPGAGEAGATSEFPGEAAGRPALRCQAGPFQKSYTPATWVRLSGSEGGLAGYPRRPPPSRRPLSPPPPSPVPWPQPQRRSRNQVDGALPWSWPRRCSIDPRPEEPGAPPACGTRGGGDIRDSRYPGPPLTPEEPHPCRSAGAQDRGLGGALYGRSWCTGWLEQVDFGALSGGCGSLTLRVIVRARGVRLPGGAARFSSWLAGGRLLP